MEITLVIVIGVVFVVAIICIPSSVIDYKLQKSKIDAEVSKKALEVQMKDLEVKMRYGYEGERVNGQRM